MMFQVNNKLLSIGGQLCNYTEYLPPPPPPQIPTDMDFIYMAKDFDGTKIPNAVPNSDFGDYLQKGTLTVNGTGSSCYLSNGNSSSNYLYKVLTDAQLTKFMAASSSSTYTFFIRVMNSSGTGGIMSTRAYGVPGYSGDHYIYMLRSEGNKLQIHTNSGHNMGGTGSTFNIDTDRVYKVYINGSKFAILNIDALIEESFTYSTNRNMTTYMTTFWAGYSSEASLARFYGLAGIPRATTHAEDLQMKACLMNQTIYGA